MLTIDPWKTKNEGQLTSWMPGVVVNKPQPLEEAFVKERERLQTAFGNRLRQLRTAKQLTLEMLAERSDLHANYVGSVERGERNVSLFNIWRIANGLGLAPSDLMDQLPNRKGKRTTPKAPAAG